MFCCQRLNKLYKFVAVCTLCVVLINFYFIYSIASSSFGEVLDLEYTPRPSPAYENTPKILKRKLSTNTTLLASQKILERLSVVTTFFESFKIPIIENDQLHSLLTSKYFPKNEKIWEIASKWVTKDQIIPRYSLFLQTVIEFLSESKVLSADIAPKGTQLKILLTLDGGQKALFKPKWYEAHTIIEGSVYAGKDRHSGEIVAFHLARLLGINRAPIVTKRVLNLRTEILPVATAPLKDTFHVKGENICFYGVCLYCKKEESVCSNGDVLEGSISLWLPDEMSIKKARHPWQRSYSEKPALWETTPDYCQAVQNSKMYRDENRLLDLVETSIFDFLIDNGDRHHYEFFSVPDSKVLLIDNAKSFGNPYVDHIDILAPLYQCCRLRKDFLSVLVSLQNGALSSWLLKLLSVHKLDNLLLAEHSKALDRRLSKVLAAVMVCFEEIGSAKVIVSK